MSATSFFVPVVAMVPDTGVSVDEGQPPTFNTQGANANDVVNNNYYYYNRNTDDDVENSGDEIQIVTSSAVTADASSVATTGCVYLQYAVELTDPL